MSLARRPRAAICFLTGLLLGAAAHADEQPLDLERALADRRELHQRGVEGLKEVLDRLFPDTKPLPGPPVEAKTVAELVRQLGDDSFQVREQATARLLAVGRSHRDLVKQATRSDDPEVKQRAQQILDTWDALRPSDLAKHRGPFGKYLEEIKDRDRLDLLVGRLVVALSGEMPEEARRHLLLEMVATAARTADDRYTDPLRPLLAHRDVRVAGFVVQTVGGFKNNNDFFPRLLLDALDNDREDVVDAVISWTPNCSDPARAPELQRRLKRIFAGDNEALKFRVSFPLMHSWNDAEAYRYLLQQTHSADAERARTATYWVGDACHSGKKASSELLEKLGPLLKSTDTELRRAAAYALGTYSGEEVVKLLLPALADAEEIIVAEASRRLLDQSDKAMLKRLLQDAARNHADAKVRTRAGELADKVP